MDKLSRGLLILNDAVFANRVNFLGGEVLHARAEVFNGLHDMSVRIGECLIENAVHLTLWLL